MNTEQEPLFPTSNEERQQMQEHLLELLAAVRDQDAQLKLTVTKARGEIADTKKRAGKIEELLRQSRPRHVERTLLSAALDLDLPDTRPRHSPSSHRDEG